MLFSCIVDIKTSYYIRNCTKDTLLINLSEVDTLTDWRYWSYDILPNDSDDAKMSFNKAIIGNLALPDTIIPVDPNVFHRYDICYLYVIRWDIAKKYSINDIRMKKFYNRLIVKKKDFHNRLFVYKMHKSNN